MGLLLNRFQSERHELAAIIVDSVRFWTAEFAQHLVGDNGHSKSVTLPRNGVVGDNVKVTSGWISGSKGKSSFRYIDFSGIQLEATEEELAKTGIQGE